MKFKNEQIENLIQFLQGSCKTLDEGVIEVLGDEYSASDLSPVNTAQIDEEIFLCEVCGWWFEVYEMSEDENDNVCICCNNYE